MGARAKRVYVLSYRNHMLKATGVEDLLDQSELDKFLQCPCIIATDPH